MKELVPIIPAPPILRTIKPGNLSVFERREIRARIGAFEKQLSFAGAEYENEVGTVKNGLQHVNHFTDGLYARELWMPAGFILTSKIHRTNHLTFVMYGQAEVIDELAGPVFIEGPCMLKTKAGTKRALRILTDSMWVTVHATEETDEQKLEDELFSTGVSMNNLLEYAIGE